VLALRAAGLTTAQIARTLKITPATVQSHTARIGQKLGLAGHAEVVQAGRELGLGRDMNATTDLGAYYAVSYVKREQFYQAKRTSEL
jgi:hypothetical protein